MTMFEAAGYIQRRLWMYVLIVMSCTALSTPAFGMDQCEEYAEYETAENLSAFALKNVPAKYTRRSRDVEVVYVSDSEVHGPASVRGGRGGYRYTVEVPAGFIARHCRQVLIAFLSIREGPQTHVEEIDAAYQTCAEALGRTYSCFDQAIDAVYATYAPKWDALPDNSKWAARKIITDSTRSLILHEYGHVLLGHLERPPRGSDELDADTFSQFYSTLSGGIPNAGAYNFTAYSVMDRSMAWGDGGHARNDCRSAYASLAGTALGLDPYLALEVFDAKSAARQMLIERAKRPPTDIPSSARIPEGCAQPSTVALSAVQRDLDLVVRFLADHLVQIDGLRVGGDPTPVVEALLQLHLQSDEGQSATLGLASYIARAGMLGAPSGDEEVRPAMKRLMNRILSEDPKLNMPSSAYGRLLGSAAIVDYYNTPKGTTFSKIIEEFRGRFSEALYYNERYSEIYWLASLIEFFDGKCAEGLRLMNLSVEANSIDEKKKEYGQVLQVIHADVEKKGCEAEASELKEAFGEGWVS